MHLHFNQCYCCTQIFQMFSGMLRSTYQKLVLLCFVTIAIVHDQKAVGQNILSGGRQDYGEIDRTDSNAEAVAVNSMSALSPNEPSCEELRMMWRFSKRQSRSSEISNELPTYRDPFAYNVWKPYSPSTRSFEQGQRTNTKYREASSVNRNPVFGRLVTKPSLGAIMDYPDRGRIMDRYYVPEYKTSETQRYRGTPRMAGGDRSGSGYMPPSRGNLITPQRGSFHRLKELVWTERAKELQAQRRAEEIAARMAILKNIANGQRNADDLY